MDDSLLAFKGKTINSDTISEKAIYWERFLLKEKGGYQDQLFAAYGGFNHIKFNQDGSHVVSKFQLSDEFKNELESHCILCYVPLKRFSYCENHVSRFVHLDTKPRKALWSY